MDALSGFLFLLVLALGVGIYFLPAVVALYRTHHNKWAILILNLLLGWTFLGWVGALIWSFTQVKDS